MSASNLWLCREGASTKTRPEVQRQLRSLPRCRQGAARVLRNGNSVEGQRMLRHVGFSLQMSIDDWLGHMDTDEVLEACGVRGELGTTFFWWEPFPGHTGSTPTGQEGAGQGELALMHGSGMRSLAALMTLTGIEVIQPRRPGRPGFAKASQHPESQGGRSLLRWFLRSAAAIWRGRRRAPTSKQVVSSLSLNAKLHSFRRVSCAAACNVRSPTLT